MPTTMNKSRPKLTWRPDQGDVANLRDMLVKYGKNARVEMYLDESGDVVGALYADEE